MIVDPGKSLTEAERAAAILAYFKTGGFYFPVLGVEAVPASEFRVLTRKGTPG